MTEEEYREQYHRQLITEKHRRRRRRRLLLERKRRRRQMVLIRFLALLIVVLFVGGMMLEVRELHRRKIRIPVEKPEMTEDFLTVNPYSRPGEPLTEVKNIFVHYTANPETSAVQNRNYFENLKDTHETYASAHFVIGYEGEIIQCIPLEEIGYAVKTRNEDSVSIECCHLTKDGSFTDATYQSLIRLVQWLLYEYDLEPEDVLRHYDVGGKLCPLYFVEHEEAWEQFKKELEGDLKQ